MLVLLGYVFDNIVHIQSEIYQPLRDATVPLVVARNALKRKSINASIDAIAPESEFQDFLKQNKTHPGSTSQSPDHSAPPHVFVL